jgi:hypothetical protein
MANAAMLMDLGNMLRGEHIQKVWGQVGTQNLQVISPLQRS